jgi:hypothetical protein
MVARFVESCLNTGMISDELGQEWGEPKWFGTEIRKLRVRT